MNQSGLALILAVSVLLSGCDKKDSYPKMGTESARQAPQIADKNGKTEITQSERDKYLQATREEIDKLAVSIEALKSKAKNSSGELKAKLEQDIKEFQENLKGLDGKLKLLKNASTSAWNEMKNGVITSLNKLKDAVRNAASQ